MAGNPKEIKKFMKRALRKFDNGSPFSAMREDEITKKLVDEQLFEHRKPTVGIATARELDRRLTMRDFAQRQYTFAPGTIYISDFVFDESATESDFEIVFERIAHKFLNHWISVEFYAEDTRLVNFFQKKAFEKVLTKVSAFAEIKVVYSNCFAPTQSLWNQVKESPEEEATLLTVHEQFFKPTDITTSLAELHVALQASGLEFAPHYSIYNKDQAWSGLSIRGYDFDDPRFIEKPTEMSKKWKKENPHLLERECQETRLAHPFFYTLAFLKARLSSKLERVRVLRLSKGNIYRHCDIQDKDAGLADGKIARFHVPLITNEGVTFHSWDSDGNQLKMKMRVGDLCYLDHRKPHAVSNERDEDRFHLVVDIYSDERVREMIRSALRREYGEPIRRALNISVIGGEEEK